MMLLHIITHNCDPKFSSVSLYFQLFPCSGLNLFGQFFLILALLGQYLSKHFQNLISSLYSFSKQELNLQSKIMNGLAENALTKIWSK